MAHIPRRGIAHTSLALGAANDVHQLGDLAALIGAAARSDRTLDTVRDVVAQNLLFGAPQRRPHGSNLGNDVDAVAVVLDHSGETADLAFDAVEPLQA
jgi:hypothetical protein